MDGWDAHPLKWVCISIILVPCTIRGIWPAAVCSRAAAGAASSADALAALRAAPTNVQGICALSAGCWRRCRVRLHSCGFLGRLCWSMILLRVTVQQDHLTAHHQPCRQQGQLLLPRLLLLLCLFWHFVSIGVAQVDHLVGSRGGTRTLRS